MANLTLEEFATECELAAKSLLSSGVPAVLRGISLAALRAVVEATYVRTGLARGNWRLSIQTADENEQPPDPGGESTIARSAFALSGLSADQKVVLSNPVAYITIIRDGGIFGRAPVPFDSIASLAAEFELERAAAKDLMREIREALAGIGAE